MAAQLAGLLSPNPTKAFGTIQLSPMMELRSEHTLTAKRFMQVKTGLVRRLTQISQGSAGMTLTGIASKG